MDTVALYTLIIIAAILFIGLIASLLYKKIGNREDKSGIQKKDYQNELDRADKMSQPHLSLMEKQLTIDGMARQLTFIVDSTYPNWVARKANNDPWLEIRKDSTRHLTVVFLSNFGSEPREANIEITVDVPQKEPLETNLQIIQMEMGQLTDIEVSDSLYVFSGETDDSVFPRIKLSDESQRWRVRSIYTTDGGNWCQIKPALNTQIKGSGTLQITTSPKSYNVPNRNATVTVECGVYPFNSLKHITLMQGVVFSYYIEYPIFDPCSRTYGTIETPLDYKENDPKKQYTVYIHCNLRWRLIKEEVDWVKITEPNFVAEKYDGSFMVTVDPNDPTTCRNGFNAARHTMISIVTETGLVKDILIYQGGYVIVKGKYWLDRNLSGYHTVTSKAVPIGLEPENTDTHGEHFQYGTPDQKWNTSCRQSVNPWNRNVEEHAVKNENTDPSPEGWRVPSALELTELYSRLNIPGNQFEEFAEKGMIVKASRYFTLWSDTGVPMFFPLSGYRSHINGSLMDAGIQGRYWSSAETSPIYAKALSLDRGKAAYITHYLKKHGFPIRSIIS